MKIKSKKSIHLIVDAIVIFILIYLDQYTKQLAINYLKDKPTYPLIENVFEFYYLENRGAAFGLFQNQKLLFVIIAVLMLVIVSYILVVLPLEKKYIHLEVALVLIFAGAVGNMIDRVINEYVVDFFYFVIINFPIFNVADIYVTVSAVLLFVFIMWVYKEEDLAFLSKTFNKSKKQESEQE